MHAPEPGPDRPLADAGRERPDASPSPDAGAPTPDAGASSPDAAPDLARCTLPERLAPGEHVVALEHGGRLRDAIVHVPPHGPDRAALPLVLMFHGLSSSPEGEIARTGLSDLADAEGFVAAYPRGIGASWNAGACCGPARYAGVDDVGFVRALIDEIAWKLCVDRGRIYATGFSNGGFMSHRLACDAADVFAAVAPVSGVLGIDEAACEPARPIPVMHTHGTADALEPFDGHRLFGWRSAPETIRIWRHENGCASEVVLDTPAREVSCDRHRRCDGEVEVVLCTIQGGGHEWYRAPYDTTAAVWGFLSRFSSE